MGKEEEEEVARAVSTFYHRHIFTPPSKSSVVREELGQLLRKHGRNLEFEERSSRPADFSLSFDSPVYCIKYIARKHGLCRSICKKLVSHLTSRSTASRTKFQVAQILKYSLAQDEDFLGFRQCLDVMASIVRNQRKFDEDGYFLHSILSQLVECVGIKIRPGNYENFVVIELQKYIPLIDSRTKMKILKKLQKWEEFSIAATVLNETSQQQGHDDVDEREQIFSFQKSNNNYIDPNLKEMNQISQNGDHVLVETGAKRNKGGGVKADAVKTQQAVMTSYKQNVSEKTEIENVSLTNALNSNRSKAAARNSNTTTTPGVKGGQGSDRSWYRTTGWEISNLVEKAESKITIKETDVEWLVDKTSFGFNFTNATVTMYELSRIAYIFMTILDYQAVSDSVMKNLAHNFFSKVLDSDYETCRLRLLRCFEIYSRRNDGKIPEAIQKKFSWFKNQNICTTDMKRLIWKIFIHNDNNLDDSFPMALDHVVGSKYRKYDSKIDADPLEYLASQMVFEERAKYLAGKFVISGLLETLLNVVQDTNYDPLIRVKVAEIVEDYLAFDDEGLSPQWLQIYLQLYTKKEMEKGWTNRELWCQLQVSLIRSVLKTFDKDRGSKPTPTTLTLLMDLCTRDLDRKLEALIVVTLGNLVRRSVSILDAERLAYKLIREDTIDENALVHLDNDHHGSSSSQEESKKKEDGHIYISSIVANILVHHHHGTNNSRYSDTTVNFFVQALSKSGDKNTRILCSECIFKASLVQELPEFVLATLRPLTLDPVADIQVHLTAAYCLCLERLCGVRIRGNFLISSQDLNWLGNIYVRDQDFVLGEKNFIQFVNPPILKILQNQATFSSFSQDIYLLLTFILNDDSSIKDREKVLNIIGEHVTGGGSTTIMAGRNEQVNKLPLHCFQAVENLFRSEPKLYSLSANVLSCVSMSLGTLLSDSSLEHAHQTLVTLTTIDEQMWPTFVLLLCVQNNQELPQFMFEDFDLHVMTLLILPELSIIEPNLRNQLALDLGPHLFQNLETQNAKKWDKSEIIHFVSEALETTVGYLGHGRRLSALPLYLMDHLLSLHVGTDGVIQCLIYAAENGQSLSSQIVQNVFNDFGQNNNLKILSLAFGLVHNNQSLPENFLSKLVTQFCTQTARGRTVGEDEEYDEIILILTKIAQQGQSPLPRARNVAQHFCNLWKNSHNSRQRMGVLMTWKSCLGGGGGGQEPTLSPEDKAKELVRRFCKFWKKSRSHRHRLEILAALKGIVSTSLSQRGGIGTVEAHDRVNLEQIHEAFKSASQDPNGQIQETGIQALISMNWNGGEFCGEDDFKFLISLQYQSGLSPTIRNNVREFLHRNLDQLPEIFKSELIFLDNLKSADDSEFLDMLQSLYSIDDEDEDDDDDEESDDGPEDPVDDDKEQKLRDFAVMHCEEFKTKFESILLQKSDQDLDLVKRALKIISKFPHMQNVPHTIFEAVAFTLVTNSGDETLEKRCTSILRKLLTTTRRTGTNGLVTDRLTNYLKTSNKHDNLLLEILDFQDHPEDEVVRQKLRWHIKIKNFISQINDENTDYDEKTNISATFFAQLDQGDDESLQKQEEGVLDLDEETVEELIQLFENYELATPCSSKIITLISAALLNPHFRLSHCHSTAGSIIETAIKSKNVPTPVTVFKAYQLIIAGDHSDDLEGCLQVLTELFEKISQKSRPHPNDQDVLSSILSCILEGVKRSHDMMEPIISLETVQLLTQQLQSPCPTFRHQSLEAVLNLRKECVKDDTEEGQEKKILIPNFETITFQIFKQIFKDHELAKKEMERDGEFNVKFVIFLFSLKYWDLYSLKGAQDEREDWFKILMISNFISSFGKTEDEKLAMALALNKLYQKYEDDPDTFIEIVQLLTQRLDQQINGMEGSRNFVIKILDTLIKMRREKAIETLNGFVQLGGKKEETTIFQDIEESAVAEELGEKFSFRVSPELLLMLAKRLVSVGGGTEVAQNLVKTISTIDDMNSLEDLIRVLDKFQKIRSTKNSRSSLLQSIFPHPESTIKVSPREAKILLECETLLYSLPEEVLISRREGLKKIFKTMLANGIRLEQIEKFIQLSLERTMGRKKIGGNFIKIFEHVTFQACQYKISPALFSQICGALKNSDLSWNSGDCIDTCCRIINDYAFDAITDDVKGVQEILSEFFQNNDHLGVTGSKEELESLTQLIEKVNGCEGTSVIWNDNLDPICKWSMADVTRWAGKVKNFDDDDDDDRRDTEEFMVEALMVAKHAFWLCTNFHLTHVQTLAIVFGLGGHDVDKGKLLQVATGSGKSAIIGVIAAIKCLTLKKKKKGGKSVDVYTSSSVLAERDAKEWSKFYSLFGLTCDHNGDKSNCYVSGEKVCYKKDIVYGDCSQFQFDYLRDTYSDLGTMAGRRCNFAIVDEVDSMFIDDSSKLARLSSTLPGMDLLQIMYHLIWDRMSFIKTHLFRLFDTIYYLEGTTRMGSSGVLSYHFSDPKTQELQSIQSLVEYIVGGGSLELARIQKVTHIESFVMDHLKKFSLALISDEKIEGFSEGGRDSRKVKLPKNLQEYAESQIPKWVDSCVTAIAFQENVHYIVDQGEVKPVDFQTTGVVQGSTNWNNGLHQFLQIKHGLKLGSESVTTNFLSNMAMFEKYGSQIVGFTGTLGSEASKNILMDVYQVELLIIPETHYKRHVRFPDFVASSEEEWLQEILMTSLEETCKRRGVLIICETIKQAEMVSDALNKFKRIKVKMYTKNMENQEKQIERIHPGDVIVATNLAGRGTDIKTANIEKYGGLHVILTFLPSSLRVEEQAFGRTSRQGKRGTGQLIIVHTNEENHTTGSHGDGDGGHQSKNLAHQLAQERDEEERVKLEQFQCQELNIILTKDTLFDKFSTLFQKIRQHIRDERSTVSKVKDFVVGTVLRRPTPSPFEVIILQAVEERWSMFLRKLDDGRISMDEAEDEYENFEKEILTDQSQNKIIQKGQNLFYFVQLGNHEYVQDSKINDTMTMAKKYFQNAIDLDPQFAVGAFVGQAYILLKGSVNLMLPDGHQNDYKEEALGQLKKSRPLLHEEMALITVMQSLVQKEDGGMSSSLFHQLTEKSNLLGSYLNNVESIISTIEKSLRKVTVTGIVTKGEDKGCGDVRPVSHKTMKIPEEKFDKYHLTFRDLLAQDNSGSVRDQAINTLTFDDWTTKAKQIGIMAKDKLKSLFDSSAKTTNFKKFPILLTCNQLNLVEFVQFPQVLSQDFELDIELLVEQMDNDDGGKLNFDFDDATLKPKSYSLQMGLVPAGESIEAKKELKISVLNNLNVEFYLEPLKEDEDVEKFVLSINEISDEEKLDFFQKLSGRLAEEKNLVSLKFTGIKFPKTKIPQLVTLVKSAGLKISSLHLTLNAVEKNGDAIKNYWDSFLKERGGRTSINLTNLDESGAKMVIPALRKLNTDFILECQDLSLDTAKFVLKKADVEQEEIEQKELKELTQLFMSDSLPLMELRDLSARGICLMVTFSERRFVPWISVVGVVALAAVQATAGAALICTGFGATVGMGLITEGMADLVTAQRIYSTRQFSWSDYRVQKAVSLVISAASMGLSSLKDGAKGASMLAQGVATEAVEQAGTRVLVNGKVLNATISVAGKNLKSLAFKQVTISAAETGARIGLKSLADSLADFGFDQVRDGITKNVSERVKNNFYAAKFRQILSFHYALDKKQLTFNVQNIVDSTTNPKSSQWLQLWSSVGSPLCNGILSSPQFLGSTFTRITMMYGIVSGMTEIGTVVTKVCTEILTKLEDQRPTLITILQSHGGLSKEFSEKIGDQIKMKDGFFELTQFPPPSNFTTGQQHDNIKATFKGLHDAQRKFDIESSDVSQMMRSVVDSVTSHIIKIANSHFVSPIMSQTIGQFVAKVSAELQDRFLVNEAQNTEEQIKTKEKVEQLKKKPESERTEEDKQFILANDRPNTFATQINANAKDFTIAWQKREIVAKAMQKTATATTDRSKAGSGKNVDDPLNTVPSKALKDNVANVLDGGAADMALMFSMAADNGVDLKIVDDPNYVLTPEEIERGVKVIVYEKGANNNDIGHYRIKTSSGELIDVPSDGNDCGYAVMGHLTNPPKTVDQLRLETAVKIIENPVQFQEIRDTSNWIRDRYPLEATNLLMVGGSRQNARNAMTDEQLRQFYERASAYLLNHPDTQEELNRPLTNDEGPGTIYVARVRGTTNVFKIGMTRGNVRERLAQQGDHFDLVVEIPTTLMRRSERVAHSALDQFRLDPIRGLDGGTEYFQGDPDLFLTTVQQSVRRVEQTHPNHVPNPRLPRPSSPSNNFPEADFNRDGEDTMTWEQFARWGKR